MVLKEKNRERKREHKRFRVVQKEIKSELALVCSAHRSRSIQTLPLASYLYRFDRADTLSCSNYGSKSQDIPRNGSSKPITITSKLA